MRQLEWRKVTVRCRPGVRRRRYRTPCWFDYRLGIGCACPDRRWISRSVYRHAGVGHPIHSAKRIDTVPAIGEWRACLDPLHGVWRIFKILVWVPIVLLLYSIIERRVASVVSPDAVAALDYSIRYRHNGDPDRQSFRHGWFVGHGDNGWRIIVERL